MHSTSAATVVTVAFDHANPHLLTHLYEDGRTLCGRDAADMERFDVTLRGKRPVDEVLDCAACTRLLRER